MFSFFDADKAKKNKKDHKTELQKESPPKKKKRMMPNFENVYRNASKSKKMNKSVYSIISN